MWFRTGLLLFLIAVILAFKFLPWYVLVGLAVVFVLSMRLLGRKLIEWVFSLPFRAKGSALRRATVEIHSIVPCAAPERQPEEPACIESDEIADDDEDDTGEREAGTLIRMIVPDDPRLHYRVEATISPKQSGQLFNHWEIGEVILLRPGRGLFSRIADDVCRIEALEVELDGQFTPDEGYKLIGPQRLRFVIAVKPGIDRLQFHYYFENIGDLVIPAST